ncbi:MAG: hypothetical protein WA810_04760 [Maribacter sp.]
MKRVFLLIGVMLTFQCCIPLRVAPNIKDYKITQGKKFKRSLPKRQMFVFEDPKEANEFYNYINTKFELQNVDVYDNIPFTINGDQYFFSFYEIDIPDKTINFVPIAIDIALTRANLDPSLEHLHQRRIGNWFIAIEVYRDSESDCLQNNSPSKQTVSAYFRDLKNEYLATHNYNEVLFKN